MEKTRWTCNGKPVYTTNNHSLIYTRKDGAQGEAYGHSPISRLIETEDVFDDTGHNVRYIKKWSVAWTTLDAALDNIPSSHCMCKTCQETTPPEWFKRR